MSDLTIRIRTIIAQMKSNQDSHKNYILQLEQALDGEQPAMPECGRCEINGKPLHNQFVDWDTKECLMCYAFQTAYSRGLKESEATIERVRELHIKENENAEFCEECFAKYPCPTIETLDGDSNE